jgi:hypothetical protein
MIFQQVLALRHAKIIPLSRVIEEENRAESLSGAWKIILDEIDYVPIFALARQLLQELAGTAGLEEALKILAQCALRITSRRAALRHDLMGRIYHRLLADAKYFGAFYTTVPAAALLLKLTFASWDDIDWADLDQVSRLRIADLACGTGTLLKATLESIVDKHVRARADRRELPDLKGLHRVLVEHCLFGLDVVPFAIHLAAAALAMHEPDAMFGEMGLYTLPLGGGAHPKLGSLEFLSGRSKRVQADLFGSPTGPGRTTGSGDVVANLELPSLDLAVMNPPFTRSVGGNLLFGNLPKRERQRMQLELQKVVRRHKIAANITAGLAPVFVALASQLLKWGGRLALVLPRALLSGVAWRDTRLLLGRNYHIQYIVVSHEPGGWNFSENTELSECLLVAKWIPNDESPGPTVFVNLWSKPKTSIEALGVVEAIQRLQPPLLDPDRGVCELKAADTKVGEVILSPPERIHEGRWNEEAAFAQTELCRVAHYLSRGKVYVPSLGLLGSIPMCSIDTLGLIGPDRRDIHDAFNETTSQTAFPALWGHDTQSVQCISQQPNAFLSPLARAKRGRNLRSAELMWSRAGRLMIAERLWLTTARVVSVCLEDPALSNTWWPLAIGALDGVSAEDIESALALWLNSTLGVLSLVAARVDTRGPWVELKKPILEKFLVLNPVALSDAARATLQQSCAELSQLQLSPLMEINADLHRARIDAVIMNALGIAADLQPLRELFAVELLLKEG